ncbi:TonB-dependent receptor [Mucilaginibacter aquatilis]|uniref:TonB-dependent receptor n=1 Tax=Mucilaginibacter aquatilis TaxID=1517760 RepID=A0A6I4ICH9_9SPHI|nr:TonB-dependent receptor [Mucilaginibacter aquatilis]MVN91558.1 TonB-dependent receptor [Mucilaginibacter aquatilis]
MKAFFTLICIFCATTYVCAQKQGKITGKVLSSDGQPAGGVTIIVNNKPLAETDDNGYYSVTLVRGQHQLQASFMGLVQTAQTIDVATGKTAKLNDIILKQSSLHLKDVVVTGQYEPQSLKNSVYQIRTISAERIRLRAATNLQQVLNTELGVRFTNDLTLGTSDIEMIGVSGQRVKILLDGVPLLDRGETRESLGQIDINMIDHIEIVEGPMSVMYGTDALGGVINLITKKATSENSGLSASVRVQEESAGKQYKGFNGSGTHNQNLNLKWRRNGWNIGVNASRNYFGGWSPGDGTQGWLPKNQLLGSFTTGYRNQKLGIWYRINATDEDIISNGVPNLSTNVSKDQKYITHRFLHELQGNYALNNKLSFNAAASYTDYTRRTQTTELNHTTGEVRLTAAASEQAKAAFNNTFFRGMALYELSPAVSFQPGIEVNLTGSTGDRILGTPRINDYAFFASSEIKFTSAITVRPGLRLVHNSVYDAPPVIPSVNAKVALSSALDLRLAYARGFRAPALRELYFNFFDASHSVIGNPNLKAEYSNSYNGSLSLRALNGAQLNLKTVAGAFYNRFNNFIGTAYDAANGSITTYLNIDKYKTVGGTLENTINYKSLQATLGFYYTGLYNRLKDEDPTLPDMSWTPEVNSNIVYTITRWQTTMSLFYKFTGKRPSYEYVSSGSTTIIQRAAIGSFNTADFTLNKIVNKALSISGGVRNLFNVTRINNTSQDVGSAHSTGGAVPVGYGRSLFLGLNYQLFK